MEATYHVPEMHCGACTASIRKAVEKVDGFEDLQVELDTRRVIVRFDGSRATAAAFQAQIERAGFDIGE